MDTQLLQNDANIGLGVIVHQPTVIGAKEMVGMGSVITRDVLPFGLVYESPARIRGGNEVGMQRTGLNDELSVKVDRALCSSGSTALRDLIPIEMERYELATELLKH